MPSLNKIEDLKFPVADIVAAACAVFRVNGFVKRDDPAVYRKEKQANSVLLYSHFYNNERVDVTDADKEQAEVLVEYLKGLSFKAFERTLTSFEANVLKFVTADSVGKEQLGIAASLPSVFQRKLEADEWTAREAELASTSDYVGTLGARGEFVLTIENIRYIAKTNSSLYSCSEGNKNIVKFFSTVEIGKVGDTVTVTGFVKNQAISKYSNAKETMINRVKITKV